MLGITATNQASSSNNMAYCGYGTLDGCGIGPAASGIGFGTSADMMLDDDMMDPLFDDDWLHEHNLDILFDLFEEEIESKCVVDSNNGSSTIFGTSPVASHLFGTSPSLSFDLLYFDNQQQQNCNLNTTNSTDSTNNLQQSTNSIINKSNGCGTVSTGSNMRSGMLDQSSSEKSISTKSTAGNTMTPTMRIKRGIKKGQSEGVSLLARPNTSGANNKVNVTTPNDAPTTSSNSVSISGNKSIGNTSKCCSSSGNTSGSNNIAKTLKFSTINASTSNSGNKIIVNRSNSDKTSAKITNFKNSILGKNDINKVTNGVEINYSKQSQNYRYLKHSCQTHVHYITGRAVIREHAYAVRGH